MTLEEIQSRYERFMVLVKRFMQYRHEWEVYKIGTSRNNMLRYKKQIDEWIAREAKVLPNVQQELFK